MPSFRIGEDLLQLPHAGHGRAERDSGVEVALLVVTRGRMRPAVEPRGVVVDTQELWHQSRLSEGEVDRELEFGVTAGVGWDEEDLDGRTG